MNGTLPFLSEWGKGPSTLRNRQVRAELPIGSSGGQKRNPPILLEGKSSLEKMPCELLLKM